MNNVLSFNVQNMITIGIMVLIMSFLMGLVMKALSATANRGATA